MNPHNIQAVPKPSIFSGRSSQTNVLSECFRDHNSGSYNSYATPAKRRSPSPCRPPLNDALPDYQPLAMTTDFVPGYTVKQVVGLVTFKYYEPCACSLCEQAMSTTDQLIRQRYFRWRGNCHMCAPVLRSNEAVSALAEKANSDIGAHAVITVKFIVMSDRCDEANGHQATFMMVYGTAVKLSPASKAREPSPVFMR